MNVDRRISRRAALVGAGKIAGMHVSALQAAGVEVSAVCDQDVQRAREVAAAARGAAVYTDTEEMLAGCKPTAVHVLTPPSSHAALAALAARHGAHVLVEKPFSLSGDEAREMLVTAQDYGVAVVPNHNYLFKPSVLRARELVAAGAVGEVVHVEAYYGLTDEAASFAGDGGGHWAQDLPGGSFTNFLPHLIYLQAAFLGAEPSVVGVATARPGPSEDFSELTVLLEGPRAAGTMTISMRARPYAKYIRVFGTSGIVHADLVGEVTSINRQRRLPRLLTKALFNLETVPQLTIGTAANTVKVLTGSMRNMPDLHTFVWELYNALETGGPLPATGDDGAMVVRVMERVWEQMPPAPGPTVARANSRSAPEPRTTVERRLADAEALADRRVLVTGAGGFLGRHVSAALVRCGADVRALVRDAGRVSGALRADTEVVAANLADPNAVQAAMEGIELVVHCAAVTTNNIAWQVHQETNIDGTRTVLDAARAAGVQRVLHVSSVVVYGLRAQATANDGVVESSPYEAAPDHWGYYQRSKLEADRMALEPSDGMETVVVRPGLLYGPGAPGPVNRGLVQLGSMRLTIGNGRNLLPLSYVENVVDGMLLALTERAAAGEAYNLVDDPQVAFRDATLEAADIAGEPTRLVPVPPGLLTAVAARLEQRSVRGDAAKPPRLSRFQIASATRDVRYDVRKARRDLGWSPEVPLSEGLRRTVGPAADG